MRSQAKAKEFYERMGYEVEVVRYNKWAKQKDFFGLWDLICVGLHDIRFVQVKTNQKPGIKWEDKAILWGPDVGAKIIKEYVVYRDYDRGITPASRVTLGPRY